ncbi:U4/U6.U5 tri-snRNP-associated protein 1 [Trichogramma pretiosum]|uniref:U4/U6.U5 tri-snRNP-associated protein 1 n=1 Tax=Trichogramma kaykai TaxID=54128 RepID=A0ABD2XK71_9HYME|nr:U4/U6.U5 tri-snRNP-associated protein 1 [Trichogramma pretiosum]
MGGSSGKKHKSDRERSSRDSRKRRRRSRSRSKSRSRSRSYSPAYDERDRYRSSSRHHKKHKKRERRDHDSDVEFIDETPAPVKTVQPTAPSPPKISGKEYDERKHTHSSRKDEKSSKRKRSPTPPSSSKSKESLSIEETNKIRAKLGLKPLEVDSGPKPGTDVFKDDLGEFHHKPAVNNAEKAKTEKIREKLATIKQKRQIDSVLSSVKTLGSDSEDDDAAAWVEKNRRIEEEKRKAAERAKLLDQMDEEFGIGQIAKEELAYDRAKAYSDKDLKGLRVEHDLNTFKEDTNVILTLKDKDVLAEDDDVLVNVNMVDDERYKKNVTIKQKKPGYDAFDESQYDEYGMSKGHILEKYDEEIGGEKRDSFTIGMVDAKAMMRQQAEREKEKLANKRLETLNFIEPKIASDYYNEEEMEKFKKPKRKVKKIRKNKMLKADDLLPTNEDYMGPPDDKSLLKLEDDFEKPVKKIRSKSLMLKPEDLLTPKTEPNGHIYEEDMSNNIVLNATAEFCRSLGEIPTYGQAGNRRDKPEFMEFELEAPKQEPMEEEMDDDRGTWNQVDTTNAVPVVAPVQIEAILDEPTLDQGIGSALKFAMSKGYLEKEENNRATASRFAHLQAQKYSIEDKAHGEDDKFNRRDRFSGPTMDFKEKDGFKPNVKLEYIDDNGHLLNAKEAFRYLSHKFHGKGPGKNKVEKRMKKNEQESLLKRMSSTDTPLGTLNLLQAKQKETQLPFIVLSGSKQVQTPTISKSKM